MSRKIIGVTVGSPLPKSNLMQTDPTKGDYVKGKEEFIKQISPDSFDLTGYATEEFVTNKIAEAELAGGDVDLSSYVQKSEVNAAINTALAQAKESGEFDGKSGTGFKTVRIEEVN